MRKRRGRNEGSIYKRKDGFWVASVRLGYTGSKGVRRTIYGKTKQEAQEKLLQLQREAISGNNVASQKISFGEFAQRWLDDYVRLQCRPATLSQYRTLVRVHVLPYISKTLLQKVSPAQIQALYSELESKGCSSRLRQMVHARLHKMFATAVKWKLIAHNPCDAVDAPRASSPAMRYLDAAQCKLLLLAAQKDPLGALYAVAIGTGLRQGELLGLRWEDVDFGAGTISIQRTLQEVEGKLTIQEPKTSKSRRMLALPEFAFAALREYRKANVENSSGWIFHDTRGGPLRKSNLIRRSFKPLLRQAGLPNIRFHDLRHTAATLLLGQGTNPKIVQEMLGHARIALTLDTYSHVTPSMQREAAKAMNELLA